FHFLRQAVGRRGAARRHAAAKPARKREQPIARPDQPEPDAIESALPDARVVAAGARIFRAVVERRSGQLTRRVGDEHAGAIVDAEARVAASLEADEYLRDARAVERWRLAERRREKPCLLHQAGLLRLPQPRLVDAE